MSKMSYDNGVLFQKFLSQRRTNVQNPENSQVEPRESYTELTPFQQEEEER